MLSKFYRATIAALLLFHFQASKAQTLMLGTAFPFAIFTANGAFNSSGATFIRGDIGTNSGAYTGSPTLIGNTHIGDATSASAATDVGTAYSQLLGYSCGSTISATLAGQTLVPNTYCITTAASLGGNLTFDAQGNPNAIFAVKINGALTTSTFSNILLVNGASTNNIYWQINGLLDIAGGSVFRGTALVNGAITLNTNSFFYGRALSILGAINLYAIESIYYDGGLWEGYTSNDFGNALNWGYREIPYPGQNIAFVPAPGNDCQLDSARTIENYYNESTKNLDLDGKNLRLFGSINQSGSGKILGASIGSELSFLDTIAQIIAASAIRNNLLYNLSINNLAGLSLNGDLLLTNQLSILGGTLETNGFLTLTSSASQTAAITEIVSGAITGLITSERYIPANGRKFRFLATPLLGTSSLQWRDNAGSTSGIGT